MKQSIILLFFIFSGIAALAQPGVSFHQSALPFVGINYTIGERFMPELRLGTDRYFEDVTVEGVLTYHYLIEDDYRLYAGFGFYMDWQGSASIPIGIQLYPLENKRFGLHIEAAPLVGGDNIFRGSWGIRYRFLQE